METINKGIIFTRYLYLKDEVEIAMLVSLLNKNEDALFWAFELYYSGFQDDLFALIWQIYYEFYATLNPTFESYLLQKSNAFTCTSSSNEDKQKIIANIINNFIIRKHTLDVFMLCQLISSVEIETNDEGTLASWLEAKNYEQIAYYILVCSHETQLENILEKVVDYFISKKVELKKSKIMKDLKKSSFSNGKINKRIMILSKIMHYYALFHGLKIGKSMYVSIDLEDTTLFDTIERSAKLPPYKILPTACICGTNDLDGLAFFKLKRNMYTPEDLKTLYNNHWEYYAYFSPVWRERIEKFQGVLNHEKKTIEFPNDELLEEFYEQYGYEPDEQSLDTKEKNIPNIPKIPKIKEAPRNSKSNCKHFYEFYKNSSLCVVDEDYLNAIEKFITGAAEHL